MPVRDASRRTFLRLAALSSVAALAGCASSSSEPVRLVAKAMAGPAAPAPAPQIGAPIARPIAPAHARVDAPLAAPAGGVTTHAGAQFSDVALSHPNVLQFFRPDDAPFALPPVRARVRLFGDMHFGFTSDARLRALADDLDTLPSPDAILTTGDEVHQGMADVYLEAATWLGRFGVPVHTVTGNHTFWSAHEGHKESAAVLYQRWLDAFEESMPSSWEIAGVRFVGIGPLVPGATTADASISELQVSELASVLAQAPHQPTVVVMHSPLRHTVLNDSYGACYTSDQPGFFQLQSDALHQVLTDSPQVALVISGHTHSPLRAQGLLALVPGGDRVVPHFNAMAVPFLRRLTAEGTTGPQPLITWEIAIGDKQLWLVGRDHLSRANVATAVVPLTPSTAAPSTSVQA